jgi:hypothetical protein
MQGCYVILYNRFCIYDLMLRVSHEGSSWWQWSHGLSVYASLHT